MIGNWDAPDHWDTDEKELWDDFVEIDPRLGEDDYAQILFHEAYFDLDIPPDDRDNYHDSLEQYLEEFGIDFDDTFDWEGYREWYETA
jgi:hypothetical protein